MKYFFIDPNLCVGGGRVGGNLETIKGAFLVFFTKILLKTLVPTKQIETINIWP